MNDEKKINIRRLKTARDMGKFMADYYYELDAASKSGKQKIAIFEGGHPVPDHRSLEGAQSIVELLSTTTEKDLVICLISGGGSALLTLPAVGISLDDIQTLTKSLLACGRAPCLQKTTIDTMP